MFLSMVNIRAASLNVLFSVAGVILVSVAEATLDPDKDPQQGKRVEEAEALVRNKQPAAAIAKCDAVINAFKSAYAGRKEKVYCATSSTESLGYLLETALGSNRGKVAKPSAIVISSIWSNAYFIKAYALQDLGRIGDAKRMIEQALALSPYNPHYLCELGEIYQLEKNWPRALEMFKKAEDHNPLAPEETRSVELGRARRGTAYVLVELGKLDEAEKKYEQCLKTDPKDTRSARELEYVRQLKAKKTVR